MPNGTPSIKVRNVPRLSAKVVLHSNDFDEAQAECARLAQVYGLTFVLPYDDPLVVAGQGTAGMKILKMIPQADTLDGIFAAVGGGGLVVGISAYVKRIGNLQTKVVGVETFDGDAMARSLKEGERVTLSEVGPFSDGTAVKIVSAEPFRVCKELLDGVAIVDTDEICTAIKDIFEGACYISLHTFHYLCCVCPLETMSITEPAGALALAGLQRHIIQNNLIGANKRFVAVVSAANMDFDRLRFVAERAELGEGREVLLSAEIPEQAGRYIEPIICTSLVYTPSPYFHIVARRHTSPCHNRVHLSLQRPRQSASIPLLQT